MSDVLSDVLFDAVSDAPLGSNKSAITRASPFSTGHNVTRPPVSFWLVRMLV
ncbi:MAG: hypothetical protein ACJZ4P_07045 [Candidatus Micropelagos sp.]